MFDTREREQVRRGLKVLVDETPLAPDFEALTTVEVHQSRRREWSPLAVFAVTATLVVVVGGFTVFLAGNPSGTDPAVSPPESATTSTPSLPPLADGQFPRLIVDQPGWSISYIEAAQGETDTGPFRRSAILYTNGSSEVQLSVSTDAFRDLEASISNEISSGGERLADETVLESQATVIRINNSVYRAFWTDNGVDYDFLAETGEESFRELLGSLTRVAEDIWIGSLSDEIITDRAAAVGRYLADIPLPPGYDTTSIEEGPVEHWYQVGADTVGAVACGWIDYWIDAKTAGDQAAVQQAVDAMAGSHQWDILNQMSSQGAFHEVVYEYADAIATDGTVPAGYETPERLTVEESYIEAFGCNRR